MKNSKATVLRRALPGLAKSPTGIRGLDEITLGGLPRGRSTLVCGGPGCGKTLLGVEYLVLGATVYKEPGVFIAFEETEDELTSNVSSLAMDLRRLVANKKLVIDFVRIERSETEETGAYDLGGLFARLGAAIDAIGAKRVVLDNIELLFSSLGDHRFLRAELRRLFGWLKEKGVTAIVTVERGNGTMTRYGLEEYVADCVILLDHRVVDQVCTRRLRVVKYRGTFHGTNEYPFLVGEEGISVLPITSIGMNYPVSTKRVSSGVPRLDAMLGGEGYYVGSNILISGGPGSGKTNFATAYAQASCRRGERCLYVALEESPSQILRNARSIGIDLEPFVKKGLLQLFATRSTQVGVESHLARIDALMHNFQPAVVVVDPVSSLQKTNGPPGSDGILTLLIDLIKARGITALFTSLTVGASYSGKSGCGISSCIDTWLVVRNTESGGERNRELCILKSRGMSHSNQVREFVISSKGIQLRDVYLGSGDLRTGAARATQEERERSDEQICQEAEKAKRAEIDARRAATGIQIESLRAAWIAEGKELKLLASASALRKKAAIRGRLKLSTRREADGTGVAL